MKRSLPSQSSIFNFFHKKTNQTELDSELITTEEVPCASTTENGAIESTVDLPELRDIGRYVDVRITDDKFKYDLLKNPWLPSSNYNFPIVSKRKLKFQISWLTRFSWLVYSKQLEGALCKVCVLFSNECTGKGSNQKVGALECFKLHSNAEYHKLSVIRTDDFLKIIDNKKPDISIAIDSAHKNIVLENRAKLVWVEKWKSVPDNELPKSAIDTLGVMSKDFYPNIWCLISIIATLPVSTSSAERSFSTLRRLKTYLRNSCSEDRLTGLALLSVHRGIQIDIEEIINTFSRMPRKVDFVYELKL
ncbi:hypothetical protein QTP88_013094 [Uroleucon formosanum]